MVIIGYNSVVEAIDEDGKIVLNQTLELLCEVEV